MKVITLENLKALSNVSFSASDTKLTLVANGVEAAVEKYLGRDLDDLTPAEASAIEFDLTAAAAMKWTDNGLDIWKGGMLARALFPLRVPAIGVGTTA